MNIQHTSSPEPLSQRPKAAVNSLSELSQTITPTGGTVEATQILGSVLPPIIQNIAFVGGLVGTVVGIQTIVLGKLPWQKRESNIT